MGEAGKDDAQSSKELAREARRRKENEASGLAERLVSQVHKWGETPGYEEARKRQVATETEGIRAQLQSDPELTSYTQAALERRTADLTHDLELASVRRPMDQSRDIYEAARTVTISRNDLEIASRFRSDAKPETVLDLVNSGLGDIIRRRVKSRGLEPTDYEFSRAEDTHKRLVSKLKDHHEAIGMVQQISMMQLVGNPPKS